MGQRQQHAWPRKDVDSTEHWSCVIVLHSMYSKWLLHMMGGWPKSKRGSTQVPWYYVIFFTFYANFHISLVHTTFPVFTNTPQCVDRHRYGQMLLHFWMLIVWRTEVHGKSNMQVYKSISSKMGWVSVVWRTGDHGSSNLQVYKLHFFQKRGSLVS